jgi:lincosamide nucleotidyltransferase A/C/D/E
MAREPGSFRRPRREMPAQELVAIVSALEEAGIAVWLDGGWAVDAALGEETRVHDDLDLVVALDDVGRVRETLAARGYALARGEPPCCFDLRDPEGRQVDVHPVTFADSGDGLYVMEEGGTWPYPAAGFAGVGTVLGRRVRCLTPDVQILCHTGYEPTLESYDDVWALSRRFELPVPDEYRRPRDAYASREP